MPLRAFHSDSLNGTVAQFSIEQINHPSTMTTQTPRITLIAAIASNRALGKDNQLLWHLSEDLKFFKRTTQNHPIIMGRKTYDSIGRPLPNRTNIVISTQLKNGDLPGCHIAGDLMQAIDIAKKANTETNTDELFIIGGAQIYAQAMQQNLANRLLITHVKRDFEADVFFPEMSQRHWQEVWRESPHDTASGLDFDFVDYRKVV